ncbi:uncharacterized protein LOC117782949 [Drosophila innubila]|uniref:uncharacterized protein LOC117782949 n=1 Tax=Drosophila innubila TaxID=198719 RepID=UPI00148C8381|nr:uncharacterized protein LOC117782949 [Drosophila innubila]
MVRRRSVARGLANQLELELMTSSPSVAQYAAWLQASTPHVASNYQLLQWQQQQQQSQPLMGRLCNKMVGCMPRLPTLPQPEVSSRKLSRLRRGVMSWPPEVIHVPHVPHVPHMPQRPCQLAQSQSVTLPHWCRATDAPQRGRQRGHVARTVETRQSADNQLKRQQQMQMWQRQQWLVTQKNNFQPFNFGKCAESFLKFKQSDSNLFAATNVASSMLPVSILKNSNKTPLEHCENFSYVKVAKQMMQPATDSLEMKKKQQLQQRSVSLDKKLLSCSNETSTTTLTNTPNEALTVGCHTAEESNQTAQAQTTSNQIHLRASEESLNQLATDIDLNLTAIRQLLELQLPENGATQINAKKLNNLATLLQQRIGVNCQTGIHLKGGESQESATEAKTELESESVGTIKSSYEPQAHMNSAETSKCSLERPLQTESATFRSSIEREAQTESVGTAINSHQTQVELKSSQERHVQTEPVASVRNSLEQLAKTESIAAIKNSFEPLTQKKSVATRKTSPKQNPQTESVGSVKSSHERQLNLNKLFQAGNLPGGESNPMWETLMQLAAHMCENKDESREKPPKQYSIYLMVSSDDENDTETEARDAQQIRQLSDLMQQENNNYSACIPGSLTYKMPENFSEPTGNFYQFPEVRKKKKRNLYRKRSDEDDILNPSLPQRKPLHWPKQDFSKASTKKNKKLLNSSCKFSCFTNPQSLRKCQYRWS